MATNTTNYNLVKPAYTEAADIAVVNGDMDKIDAALTAQSNGYALIANGNTHVQIAQGQYVYVRNHSSLSEGLYRATSTIQANGTLSTSNLTRDSAGELNYIQNEISTLNSKISILPKFDAYLIAANSNIALTITGNCVITAIGPGAARNMYIARASGTSLGISELSASTSASFTYSVTNNTVTFTNTSAANVTLYVTIYSGEVTN